MNSLKLKRSALVTLTTMLVISFLLVSVTPAYGSFENDFITAAIEGEEQPQAIDLMIQHSCAIERCDENDDDTLEGFYIDKDGDGNADAFLLNPDDDTNSDGSINWDWGKVDTDGDGDYDQKWGPRDDSNDNGQPDDDEWNPSILEPGVKPMPEC